jgi:hypothetical protein
LRYRVTDNVTSPVVAETNNEEDRADVYSRTVRKRRLPGFTDTITDRFQSTPDTAPALIPTRSVRSPSGGSSPVDLVLSRELLSIHLPLHPSRLCVSSLLPNFHLTKNAFPLSLSTFLSRPHASHSPLSLCNRHAFASNPTDPSVLNYPLRSRQVALY